ncbi:MAG: hypothetical protein KF752_00105 [Pirellulaceae bacterium]|nr:hypothetical protein [Pirellulaceae bacterium]
MNRVINTRGWLAAGTLAVMLTVTCLVVEKHLQLTSSKLWRFASRSVEPESLGGSSIVLRVDTNLESSQRWTPNRSAGLHRRQQISAGPASLLRRPPDPAANAVLREPLTSDDFVSLPLTRGHSSAELLMHSMDRALQAPIQTVSLASAPVYESLDSNDSQRLEASRSPAATANMIPEPTSLLGELAELNKYLAENGDGAPLDFAARGSNQRSDAVSTEQSGAAFPPTGQKYVSTNSGAESVGMAVMSQWSDAVQTQVRLLISQRGLEHPECRPILDELTELSLAGEQLGQQCTDYNLAQMLIRTGYSLKRRVDTWSAIRSCLDETSIQLSSPQASQVARSQIALSVAKLEALLSETTDRDAWRRYLLLDELTAWTNESSDDWRDGHRIAKNFLSRISWVRLDSRQSKFLEQDAVREVADSLTSWSRSPVDYRHLLTSVEQSEIDENSRLAANVAETIQILRNSPSINQRQLADTLNTHYRNANLRLTISQDMIQRFLPEDQHEVRPVRQNILGAQTSGDSAIQTRLSVRLQPDPQAWNIELGVDGDMASKTQSSKGPAVFHNTSTAQIHSQRYLRMGPTGYDVSTKQPTQVASQDYLHKMSTDFDGLPVIGDFARLIVREQFNQKRGLAKRITQRKIAQEVDQGIDKRIEDSLTSLERDLRQRILGPLERLTLEPMVVSMSTTQDRLTIRYRLAAQSQLTAHTPRPRAPTECLTSFQVHQSVINNTIEKTGLSERSWTLAELYQRLGDIFQTSLTPPEDVPNDISLRFAARNPITVELRDGQLRLHLRFAEFRRTEGMHIKNFAVTSTYVPIADGLSAGFVRHPEAAIEIQGKHLPMRDRLALRVIFAKVFVSNPEMSLIAQQWSDDPRAAGLAVSQLELRDGWFSIAVSSADSPLAAEVAARSQLLKPTIH